MRRIILLLAALALSGCATYSSPYRGERAVYSDGSYYSPSADGYGDYYYAPEYRYNDYYYDRFWYSSRYDFLYGQGRWCSFGYHHCPFGYGNGWHSGWGWSLFYGDPFFADPWGWPYSSWHHHRPHHDRSDDSPWRGRVPERRDDEDSNRRNTTPAPVRLREPIDVERGRVPRRGNERNYDERPIYRGGDDDAPPPRRSAPPVLGGGDANNGRAPRRGNERNYERPIFGGGGYEPPPPRRAAPPVLGGGRDANNGREPRVWPAPGRIEAPREQAPRVRPEPREEPSRAEPRREREQTNEDGRDGNRRPRLQ
jgi:hypothetical protein